MNAGGNETLKKRICSGLLAVWMLCATAFAAGDTSVPPADAAETTLLFQAELPEGYDSTRLARDMESVQAVLRERLTNQGVTEAEVSLSGESAVAVTLPADAAETVQAAAEALVQTAALSFQDADGKEWLTGADIKQAKAGYGRPTGYDLMDVHYVQVEFTEEGAKKFAEASEAIAARTDDTNHLTILMDGQVISSPSIAKKIEADSCAISGSFTAETAKQLASLINAGPLPLKLTLVTEGGEGEQPPDEPEPEPLFPDLAGHWAEAQMTRGAELGLLQGVNGKALPNNPVKRNEALIILNRVFGAAQAADISAMANVPANAWYAEDVAKAAYLGLVDADDSRNFDTAATRAEAFELLARAFVYSDVESDSDALAAFSDTAAMTAAQRRAAKALIGAGVVQGNADGTLDPAGKLTRAQFVTMLLRIVPNFPTEEDDLTALSGGALLKAPDLDFTSVDPDGDRIFACATEKVAFSGVNATGRLVFKGAETLSIAAKNKSALALLALDTKGGAKAVLSENSTLGTLLLAGRGGEVSYKGAAETIEITASDRTIDLSGMEASRLVISGSGNTITLGGKAEEVVIDPSAKGTKLTVNGKLGTLTVSAIGCTVDGKGKAASIDVRAVDCDVTLSADSNIENIDPGLTGVSIDIGVPAAVSPGGSLLAVARFEGVSEEKLVTAQWYRDGKALDKYKNTSFSLTADATSRHTAEFTFTKDMQKNVTIGFKVSYFNPSTGETEEVYAEKTVPIQNYSDEWYYQRDVNRVLNLVSSTYKGNYTTAYAVNNDYQGYEKEVWINAKGYSSKSQYLCWINRAYQHVNVFQGSKGKWKLIKSFVVGTGASSSPTPTGVTTVSYKSAGGWTTGTYTVRPVVGFYPGTGYAFHSRLSYPGTDKEYDFSSGYPVSHGCVRMQKGDINWIYNNIPVGTTVVIF